MNTEKIEKLKKSLSNPKIPADLKPKIEAEIKRLEDLDAKQSEPKEEEKEVKPVAKKTTTRKPRATKSVAKKTSTAKPSQTSKPKRTAMSVAKEIRKEGESWKDAMARASKVMKEKSHTATKDVETELEKLTKLVRGEKNKEKISRVSDTNLKRDASRKAKPLGARKVTRSGETSNQYGTYKNHLGRKYVENRDKHGDRLAPRYPKNSPYLAEGGYLTDPNFGNFQNTMFADGGALYSPYTDNPLKYLSLMGAKTYGDLNYSTEHNGIDYYVGRKKDKNGDIISIVVAFIDDENKYMIEREDAKEMSETAREMGVDKVELYTNYGVELHTTQKPKILGFDKIVKVRGNYADGGGIPNNYEGKTPEQVWNSLSVKQREHFLLDHYYVDEDEFFQQQTKWLDSEDKKMIDYYSNKTWNKLSAEVKKAFTSHVKLGQYAKGGGVRRKNGQTYDYGRVWTKDHNEFDKGADHEVNYRRKKLAKGGRVESLTKELYRLQRDLNSSRLQTYRLGDNSQEAKDRKNEREVKLARFNEVLKELRESDAKFELGGNVVTDLAGHTGGSLGTGDPSMLDGVSGTAYTGLVGETGAMSSGEMFAYGGGLKNLAIQGLPNDSSSKQVKYWASYIVTTETEDNEKINSLASIMDDLKLYSNMFFEDEFACLGFNFKGTKQQLKDNLVELATAMKKMNVRGKLGLLNETSKEVYDNLSSGEMFAYGGGLPSGVSQSYMITESLGNPAQHFAKGGGVGKMYYHILEYGDYGNIGYQGYYDTLEEAQKQVKKLSDYFPNQTFQIFADKSRKEPPITTMAKGGGIRRKNGQTYDYGRVWTKDHNEFDKGADHEVNYRRKGKFLGVFAKGGGVKDDRYDGKTEKIVEELKKLKGGLDNKAPYVYQRDGYIYVSAEEGDNYADYDNYLYIDEKLEDFADKYDTYWDWENAGAIVLVPLSDEDEYAKGGEVADNVKYMKDMMVSLYTYGGIERGSYGFNRYLLKYEDILGKKLFDKTYNEELKRLQGYEIEQNTSTDSEGLTYNSLKRKMATGGGVNDESPKIYVADLEAYNNGRLSGVWLDLADYSDADELMEAIQDFLKTTGGEEYAIHDVEYIPSNMYSEYMGQKDFEELYEMIDLAKENDLPLSVVQEVVSQYDASAVDEFQGKYDDAEDFAQQLVDDTGIESFTDFEYYLYITDTDRRLLSQDMADSYVDDIKDEDGGNRLIEEAGLDVEEYEEAESDRQEEMLDEAREIVYDEYYNTYMEGLSDPYYFLVEEQGMYDAESFANASFVRIDFEKLADALEQDYTFIFDGGSLYVFNIR